MKSLRKLAVITATTASVIAAATSPAQASQGVAIPAAGGVFVCSDGDYTATSGVLRVTETSRTTRHGGTHVSFRLRAEHVRLTDAAGTSYRLVGGVIDEVDYPTQDTSAQPTRELFISRFGIIRPGAGVVHTAVVRMRLHSDGEVEFLQSGDCTAPDTA